MSFSFVIPVNNEEGNIDPLVRELEAVIPKMPGDVEVICVDDGSTDGSRERLLEAKERCPWLKLVFLDGNHGQSAAFFAGIQRAAGDSIITMDADLQNDPADVLLLLEHYPAHDVVVGVRARRHDSAVRRISSRVANAVRNRLTDESISDTGCSLKLFRADYIKKVPVFNGMHRFFPTLCRMQGATVREVPVSHRPRTRGRSHYGISNRMVRGLADVLAVRWMKKRTIRYSVEKSL